VARLKIELRQIEAFLGFSSPLAHRTRAKGQAACNRNPSMGTGATPHQGPRRSSATLHGAKAVTQSATTKAWPWAMNVRAIPFRDIDHAGEVSNG